MLYRRRQTSPPARPHPIELADDLRDVAVEDGADEIFLPRAERRVTKELTKRNSRIQHGSIAVSARWIVYSRRQKGLGIRLQAPGLRAVSATRQQVSASSHGQNVSPFRITKRRVLRRDMKAANLLVSGRLAVLDRHILLHTDRDRQLPGRLQQRTHRSEGSNDVRESQRPPIKNHKSSMPARCGAAPNWRLRP